MVILMIEKNVSKNFFFFLIDFKNFVFCYCDDLVFVYVFFDLVMLVDELSCFNRFVNFCFFYF